MLKKKNFLIIGVLLIIALMFFTTSSFAANNYAYCISTQVNADTAPAALWAYSYYTGAGYEARRYNDPSSATFTSMLNVNPRILFMAGHGNTNGMYFRNSALVRGSSNYFEGDALYCGASKYSWGNSLLVVLMGSNTGTGTSNITSEIASLNSKAVVMGWRDVLYDNDIIEWSKLFNQHLRDGYNIRNSMSYANSSSNYIDSSIKDISVYGSQLTTITPVSSFSNSEATLSESNVNDDEIYIPNRHDIDYEVNYSNETDMVNIHSMLENEFKGYNPENYDLKIVDGQTDKDKIIDLKLKIGDFSTNNGYVIFIENNKVTDIYNNHTYTNDELNNIIEKENLKAIKLSDYVTDIKTCKEKTSKKLLKTFDKSVNTTQEAKLYYDIKAGKKYIRIITENEKNNTKSALANDYEI